MTTKLNTKRGFYYIRLNIDVAYISTECPEANFELLAGTIVIAPIESDYPQEHPGLGKRTIADIPNQNNPRWCASKTLYRYENGTKEFDVLCEVPTYQEFDDLREEAADAEMYELGNPEQAFSVLLQDLAQQISVYGKSPAEVLDDVFREHKIFCEMREVA